MQSLGLSNGIVRSASKLKAVMLKMAFRFIGTIGYGLYMAGLYNASKSTGPGASAFLVLGGVLLGASAGVFWTAQGALILAYAREEEKGAFIATFWVVFNSGAVIGSVGKCVKSLRPSSCPADGLHSAAVGWDGFGEG